MSAETQLPVAVVESLPPLTMDDIVEITAEIKEKQGDVVAAAEARGLLDA